MSNDKLLDRINKLMNMAESAKELGNEQEALAFTEKYQKLLHENKISMAEVDDFCAEDLKFDVDEQIHTWAGAGIEPSGKRSHWLSDLTSWVARYNGCRMAESKGTNAVWIIGTAASRQIVSYLIDTLARYAMNACEQGYRKRYYQAKKQDEAAAEQFGLDPYRVKHYRKQMKGWKRSFLSAFVGAVGKRLKERYLAQMGEVTERGLIVHGAMAGKEAGENATLAAGGISSDGKRQGLALGYSG